MKSKIRKIFVAVLIVCAVTAIVGAMIINNDKISIGLSVSSSVISAVIIALCFSGIKKR